MARGWIVCLGMAVLMLAAPSRAQGQSGRPLSILSPGGTAAGPASPTRASPPYPQVISRAQHDWFPPYGSRALAPQYPWGYFGVQNHPRMNSHFTYDGDLFWWGFSRRYYY